MVDGSLDLGIVVVYPAMTAGECALYSFDKVDLIVDGIHLGQLEELMSG